MGLLGVALKLAKDFLHLSIPQFAPTNPLYRDWVSVMMFGLLAYSLFYFARKPVEEIVNPVDPNE